MWPLLSQNQVLLFLLLLWTLPWKGVALWKAARLHDKIWFIIILVINTVGVLEIIYIFSISKRKGLMSQQGIGVK